MNLKISMKSGKEHRINNISDTFKTFVEKNVGVGWMSFSPNDPNEKHITIRVSEVESIEEV